MKTPPKLLHVAAFSCTLLWLSGGCATAAPPVLPCEPLSSLRADDGGQDRSGHLWLWDQKASRLGWLDSDGELVELVDVPGSRSLAADRTWGIAAVGTYGSVLRILRPGEDEPAVVLELPREVATVAWLGRDRVALGPTRAGWWVEVWDVARGERVEELGEGHEIATPPGATFLRVLRLAPAPDGAGLITLDSLDGTLRRLTPEGDVRFERSLEAHRSPAIEQWRRELDRKARERGVTETPLYWVLDLQVTPDGDAYVVEHCSEDRTRVRWVRVSPSGGLQRVERELGAPVCSLDFIRWRDGWVFLSKGAGAEPRAHRCRVTNQGESS